MTDAEQPELFSLAPPPAAKPTCPECGVDAVVVRFGVVCCLVCSAGPRQRQAADAAERVAGMVARARQKHITAARRRNR